MDPMDVDPLDDGPTDLSYKGPQASPTPPIINAISEEEEARQAIEMLRGDDVSGRVAAANRLEAVAAALGQERTREVSSNVVGYVLLSVLC